MKRQPEARVLWTSEATPGSSGCLSASSVHCTSPLWQPAGCQLKCSELKGFLSRSSAEGPAFRKHLLVEVGDLLYRQRQPNSNIGGLNQIMLAIKHPNKSMETELSL